MELINALSNSLLNDSLGTSIPKIEVIAQLPEKSLIEHLYSSATVIIALANLLLVIYIFSKNNTKDKNTNEKNRKINLLKTLVLDYNISKFYSFFTDVSEKTKLVNVRGLSMEDRAKINDEINDLATDFRQSFIDLFIAIDNKLYDDILKKTDLLIDGLTNTIFDEGINLAHKPKFEESITKEIRLSKTEIIRTMFSYSGE
ncbi:hypothetical protein PbJCM13498_35040 [Prolixibacter bellariivorans]|uniref:Uncharacterized protein n=1 Tax=Prolixibacter bellariivorans TaxID=314319 RepID=A0A5M4B425_9BACT|nr:hypothetical protein [Prolixibacter bellariivorans]GET34641.1 hypothetical protein PbJCM13498_35040 [Prolixibacter bellariivorans]